MRTQYASLKLLTEQVDELQKAFQAKVCHCEFRAAETEACQESALSMIALNDGEERNPLTDSMSMMQACYPLCCGRHVQTGSPPESDSKPRPSSDGCSHRRGRAEPYGPNDGATDGLQASVERLADEMHRMRWPHLSLSISLSLSICLLLHVWTPCMCWLAPLLTCAFWLAPRRVHVNIHPPFHSRRLAVKAL